MYLAIYILKQDLLKVLKFDLLKKTSDFIYIMEIRGFLMNVTYLIYIIIYGSICRINES